MGNFGAPRMHPKKVIQFDGHPEEVKGMDHVHVAIVIVSMNPMNTLQSYYPMYKIKKN